MNRVQRAILGVGFLIAGGLAGFVWVDTVLEHGNMSEAEAFGTIAVTLVGIVGGLFIFAGGRASS
jgi:hypothetical protein